MKFTLFLVLIFSSFVCPAQSDRLTTARMDKSDWVRLESDAKDFSIAVPADFVVDNEEGLYRVYSNKNGVSFTVEMEPKKNFKGEFKRSLSYIKDRSQYKFFQSGDFIGIQYEGRNKDEKFYMWLQMVSSNGVYTVSAFSKDLTNDDHSRFLYSMQIGNKPFFLEKANFPAERQTILISSLKTDEIVLKALRQKDSEQAKLEKAAKEEKEIPTDNNKYSRSLIILRQSRPGYTESARQRQIQGSLRLKVEFLASGQIGNIKLVSSLDSGLEKRAFQAAKKIKFIPAEIDGKPTDVTKLIEYNFSIY